MPDKNKFGGLHRTTVRTVRPQEHVKVAFIQDSTLSRKACKYCDDVTGLASGTNALSFYRSQNVLGWSKFFVPDQKFIYILWQSQTFCARQKDDLHSVKLVFVLAQKFLKRH